MAEEDERQLQTIQVRLPRGVIERIDRYRLATSMRPPRSMMIRYLVENALAQLEKEDEDARQSRS